MAEPEPDWYPDPAKTPGVFRWWTGEEWTDLLASDPDAPPPAAETVTRSVRPSGETSPGHLLRNTLVIGAVLAAVLTLFTVLGFQPAVASRYPEGTPSDFGTPKVIAPASAYDEGTRVATVRDQMTVTMPPKPFEDPFVSVTETEVFLASVSSDLLIHKPSDTSNGWYGTALLGLVNPPLVTDGDLHGTAEAVVAGLGDTLYNGAAVELSALDPLPDVGEGFEGFTGEIGYDIKGVPSSHDDVVIILAALDDGEVGVWGEVIPNDAPDSARTDLEQARGTLQLG